MIKKIIIISLVSISFENINMKDEIYCVTRSSKKITLGLPEGGLDKFSSALKTRGKRHTGRLSCDNSGYPPQARELCLKLPEA